LRDAAKKDAEGKPGASGDAPPKSRWQLLSKVVTSDVVSDNWKQVDLVSAAKAEMAKEEAASAAAPSQSDDRPPAPAPAFDSPCPSPDNACGKLTALDEEVDG